MSTTIEQLELEVQSSATSAVSGIDALASSLGKLKSSVKGGVGLTAVAKQLTTLNTALNGVSGTNADNLNKLAQGLQTLSTCGNLKLSSSVATQITNIGNAVRSLHNTNFTAVRELANSLAPLSQIGKANLNSFISQLQRLPQAVQALNSVNVGSLSINIRELVSALTPLTQMGKNNLTSFITQLQKLPQIMVALRSVNIGTLASQIQQLANAFAPLAAQMQSISNGFSAMPTRLQRLIQQTNNLSYANNRATKSYTNFVAKIAIAAVSLRSIVGFIGSCITQSNEYIEDLNLFTVSMGEYANEAQAYAEKVADAMGIDPAEWMRNQGIFMTITEGFGVASDRAYTMSQNLTQLGYDMSSYFNRSFEESMQKLQSGIAGELEPLRRWGYDLSIARLQQEALTLGIEKNVNAMTQAEKAELRYYAIMTQVTTAQGDMARTLEAPANQFRILKAQVVQCARAFGNVFIPILNKVLPYVIAVVKVLRMVIDIIARLFGTSLPKMDYSSINTTVGGIADSTNDIASGLGSATKKAKELKNALLGIDELNIISPPENSDSGGSGSGVSGISGGSLGFDLPTYDFLGDAVNSKVADIVNKMKEWLGITGEINSWSDLFNTRLGKILIAVGLIGGAFLLWKLSRPFVAAFSAISSFFGGKKSNGAGSIGKRFSVPSPKTALKALADIAIIIGGLVMLVEAIGLLMQIPGFEEALTKGLQTVGNVFKGLWDIILPLTVVTAGMVMLGSKISVSSVAKGFAGLAVVIGGATVLITAIGAFTSIPYFSDFLATGVNSVVSVFKGLWEVALPIGALSGVLIALGIATPGIILSGLVGFASVIVGLEAVLVALGALNQIPGFSWIVGEGGKVLCQLGNILGEFIGSIVEGAIMKVSSTLPEVGRKLSEFMTEAQPFFTGLESVNGKSVDAAKKVAEIIVLLTSANLVKSLSSWFVGNSSFADFGDDLCAFAESFKKFCSKIEGVDASTVRSAATAAKAMAELANNIPNSGGLVSFFAGENDIDVWGEKLPGFAENFKKFSDNLAGVRSSTVQCASAAAKSVAEFATNIPNSGGLVAFFTGENDIDKWGSKLPTFAEYFKKFSENIDGVDANVIKSASSAAKTVAEFANNIPKNGGWASVFGGDNDISVFGARLVLFGRYFREYCNSVSGVETTKLSSVNKEIKAVIDWSGKAASTDTRALTAFGASIENLGSSFASFATSIVSSFSSRIMTDYSNSKSSIISWGSNVRKWFTQNSYGNVNRITFGKFAQDIIDGFRNTIVNGYKSVQHAMTTWGTSVSNWFNQHVSYNVFKSYAENVVKGFNNGINVFYETSRPYLKKWADDIKKTFTTRLDEQSPSREFYKFGVFAVEGFNNAIADVGSSTKKIVENWTQSFMSITPKMQVTLDTSSMRYYDGVNFEKTVHPNVTSNSNFAVVGFEDSMKEFYLEYIEPAMSQIAEDMRRQADKNEQTIVQIGNRTVSDAITTQQRANGYAFAK